MARPRTPRLHQEKIVAAALEILTTSGSFTMGQLARSLDVRPSSLYNHVHSKAQVVQMIRDQWLGEVVEHSRSAAPGKPQLRLLIHGYYEFVARTPGLISMLVAEPLVEEASYEFYSALTANLRQLCDTRSVVATGISLIDALVLGRAVDQLSPPFAVSSDTRQQLPHLDWLTGSEPDTRHFIDGNIDALIDMVLNGIAAVCPHTSSITTKELDDHHPDHH